MSEPEEIIEDVADTEPSEPMEVKIVNQPKPESDSKEDVEYDNLNITAEEIKEFEDGETSSSQ